MSENKVIRRACKPFASVEQVRENKEKPRTALMDFCPPKDNRLAKFIARFIVPKRLNERFGVTDVEIIGLGYLKSLKGERCVLPFNHPSRKDPEVAFTVGVKADEYFNYLAAREVFDERNGWMGRIMQWLGCYSVVRGTADRDSFKTTQRLLVENKQKLVIYREGEINSRNDDPLDCEPGVIRLAMWALQQLDEEGRLAPIYLPRVGTKFRYVEDIQPTLESCITRLEQHLLITAEGDLYARLRKVCIRTLAELQTEYGLIHNPDESTLDEQVTVLRNTILDEAASLLKIKLPNVSTLDRLRVVRNAIDERVFKNEAGMSPYKRLLDRRRAEALTCVYPMMRTVQLFIAARDGYVKETMTQERCAEVIDMLELEHFGASTVKGKSIAFVYIGKGINLLDYYDEYKKDAKSKKAVLQKLAAEVSKGGREAIRLADEASYYIPHRTIT
jgi:hypothetical protein